MRHIVLCFLATCSWQPLSAAVFFSPAMIQSHLVGYNEEDKKAIDKDLDVVRSVCWMSCTPESTERQPVYLATAGSPGSRKNTILERFLAAHPGCSSMVYLDPDQRGLRFMVHTYYSQSLNALMRAQELDYAIVQKNAYEKWRGASNYIALTLLEEAFAAHQSIAHGVTSTGGHIPQFYQKVKEAGYEITLLLSYCEEAFIREAVTYRNAVHLFYQSTPEDEIQKAQLFPKKIPDYLAWADTLYLYWSDNLATPERLAAVLKDGDILIQDSEAFDHFVQKYEKDRTNHQAAGTHLTSWDQLMADYRMRYRKGTQ